MQWSAGSRCYGLEATAPVYSYRQSRESISINSIRDRNKQRMLFNRQTAEIVFAGHNIQALATQSLMPPAIHNGVCILRVFSEMKPPATAPTSIATKAETRLFLFMFFLKGPRRAGSVDMSCNILVKTTVGTSANPSTRLPTICPALWKDRSAIGNNCLQVMSSVIVSRLPLTTPP